MDDPRWQRERREALLRDLLATQATLVRCYESLLPEAPEDLAGTLLVYGEDARFRAGLVEQVLRDAGAEPARSGSAGSSGEAPTERDGPVLRFFRLLTELLLLEEREWILWEALDLLAHTAEGGTGDVMLTVVEAIESNEALGAGAVSRHRDRAKLIRKAIQDALLDEFEVPPARRKRLLLPRH
ncbi:MAG: hypothetical protein QOK40_3589 [Miltoncostaeaceae bacterium]|nr:hypothetical protein [Miltoncostaeaceae bacterium]